MVITIFGTPLFLSDPNGVACLQRMLDVSRQRTESFHHFSWTFCRAFHNKAFVQTHQLGRTRLFQEIIADRNPYGTMTCHMQSVVD
ncbi:Uncharacterised protein [Vibrio cholerae]|nr:Uncharacterised protein [Vibrio cholerae]CSB53326.1 Uncharacterised protein [Vibrio cholerae]